MLFSLGAVSMFLGRLEGCSFVLGLPVGPVGQNRWFDRMPWTKVMNYEQRIMTQMAGAPNLFMAFSGGGRPIIKTKHAGGRSDLYEGRQDEDFMEAMAQGQAEVYEKIMGFAGVLDDEES